MNCDDRATGPAPFPSIRSGQPALTLAPMEGVTDAPMRALLTQNGGFHFCVSEFLRISQSVPPAKTYYEHLPELRSNAGKTPSGTPVQLQLLGGDPGRLAEAAQRAVSVGIRAIDLNFGCPAPTVNRHDGGATLLKHPERIREIVRAVREALPPEIPVSAKLRLGWDCPDSIHLNAQMAEEGGASWITIHARTKEQGYRPPAHWKLIGEVRKNLGVPLVANGEIWTLEDFRRCRDETGCEHFMLGRGALADPLLSLRAGVELGLIEAVGEEFDVQEPSSWHPWLIRFFEIGREQGLPPGYSQKRIKQWLNLARIRWPLEWFHQIKTAQTAEEIFEFFAKEATF